MGRRRNIPDGTRFNNRVVIREVAPDKWKARQFLCRCDCGSEVTTRAADLLNPLTNYYCANCQTRYHELWAKHPELPRNIHRTHAYSIWSGMIRRCKTRGEEVCSSWKDFANYLQWYLDVTGLQLSDALRPQISHSFFKLERITTDLPWGPDNFSTAKFKTERAWDTMTYRYWKQLLDDELLDDELQSYKTFVGTFGLKLPGWFLTKREFLLPHSKHNSFWKKRCSKTT